MIASMTGFASVSREANGDRVSATVKSVNHRFLDVQLKVPQALASIESRLRSLIQTKLTRGRVELSLVRRPHVAAAARSRARRNAARVRFRQPSNRARENGIVTGALTASDVLAHSTSHRHSHEARATDGGGIAPALAELVDEVVEAALVALVGMRDTEGRYLATDLDAKLTSIVSLDDGARGAGQERAVGAGRSASGAARRTAGRPGRRSGVGRARGRAFRVAVGCRRGNRPHARARGALARAGRQRGSRAAASSIFCCRK